MNIKDLQQDIIDRTCNPIPWSKETGNTLRIILPNQFDAYCKILHPFIEDLDTKETSCEDIKSIKSIELDIKRRFINRFKLHEIEWKDLDYEFFIKEMEHFLLKKYEIITLDYDLVLNSYSEDIINDLSFYHRWSNRRHQRVDEVNQQSLDNMDFSNLKNTRKLTWKELAQRYELIFHNNINPTSYWNKLKQIGYPLNLYSPLPYLDEMESKGLISVLKKFTPSLEFCSLQFEFINEAYKFDFKDDFLDNILRNGDDKKLKSGYLLCKEGNWIVWSDVHEDLQLTLVAGSRDLIESLKTESNLEIQECTLDTRVDYYSDYLNVTPSVF
jgi:hypothetical protein